MMKKYILKNYNIKNFLSFMMFMLEGNLMYGYSKGEWMSYYNFELFLKMLYLEVNDVFVMVFLMMNVSCCMVLFMMDGGMLKSLINFMWFLMFYNISFMIFCFLVFLML